MLKRNSRRILAGIMSAALILGGITIQDNTASAAKKPKVRSVSVSNVKNKKLSLQRGEKFTLKLKILPAKASKKVTYKTSNKKFVTVSKKGRLTAKAVGKATITIRANDGSKKSTKITVTVTKKRAASTQAPAPNTPSPGTPAPDVPTPTPTNPVITDVKVQSIALSQTSATLYLSNHTNESVLGLVATVNPSHATNRSVTFLSSNPSVATVDASGRVQAVGKGSATITATSTDGGNVTATCLVTVVQRVTRITLEPESKTIKVGESTHIRTNVEPNTADNREVEYATSNSAIATVDASGRVTGVANGTVTITATAKDGSNITGNCSLTVSEEKLTLIEAKAINPNFDLDVNIKIMPGEKVPTEEQLRNTTLTLTHETNSSLTVVAKFKSINSNNSVIYTFDEQNKALLKPTNGTANGNYIITSSTITIPANTKTSYKEALIGNTISGFVYDETFLRLPIKGAKVSVSGAQSVETDENGYYEIPVIAGELDVTVSAEGFFDSTAEDVIVDSNNFTAYNFGMEYFDREKLHITGNVMEPSTQAESNFIEGALVHLYESTDGVTYKIKASVTTDATGKFAFTNSRQPLDDREGETVQFSYGMGIHEDYKYKISITKGLSPSNLFNVYEPYDGSYSADIPIHTGKPQANLGNLYLTPVKESGELRFRLSWDASAYQAVTSTIASSENDIYVSVEFLAPDGETTLVKPTVINVPLTTADGKHIMSEPYALLDKTYFGSSNGKTKPTLPSGTYYLVIRNCNQANTQVKNATTIIPLVISQPGQPYSLTGEIKTGLDNYRINTNVDITSTYYNRVMGNQTPGSALEVLSNNLGVLGKEYVRLTYLVYQKVGGVNVKVGEVKTDNFTVQTTGETKYLQVQPITMNNLLEDASYVLTPIESYISRKSNNELTFTPSSSTSTTVDFNGAANVRNIQFSNIDQFGGRLSDYESVHLRSLKLIDNKDASNTYSIDFKEDEYNLPAYSLQDLVTPGMGFNIPMKNGIYGLDGIAPGDYKVEVQFDEYETFVTNEPITIIDFQKANLTITGQLKRIIDTEVSGTIQNKQTTDDIKNGANIVATVLLYDQTGRIVAATNYRGGQYKLIHKENGYFTAGTYTLVVRAPGYETFSKRIEVADNIVNSQDIQLTPGANAMLKFTLTDTTDRALSNGVVKIMDEYYVSNYSLMVEELAQKALNDRGAFLGDYYLTQQSNPTEWYSEKELSAGTYYMDVTSQKTRPMEELIEIYIAQPGITIDDKTYKDFVAIKDTNKLLTLDILNKSTNTSLIGYDDLVIVQDETGAILEKKWVNLSLPAQKLVTISLPEYKTYTVKVYSSRHYVKIESVMIENVSKTVATALQFVTR